MLASASDQQPASRGSAVPKHWPILIVLRCLAAVDQPWRLSLDGRDDAGPVQPTPSLASREGRLPHPQDTSRPSFAFSSAAHVDYSHDLWPTDDAGSCPSQLMCRP